MLRPSRSISSLISTESLVNITLRRLEAALEDAALGSGNETTMADTNYPSEKGIFRWARALYELKQYGSCLEALEKLTKA
ncbi:hypothetical protein MCOR27_000856 [Pyricularia oryzae]|nr:hypothetical protein MCOR27_000856 [Pyricularia oryzae]KAI6452617.1 hypothetical protein MCOR15_008905 [Pyricularia oryzae]KAI6467323.1 hypothetical protein MCOR17_004506 [Pyricularia oryzae]KAI6593304.1 hypothetical protein MCOR04_003380 [Pyricularia oryzae]KAI6597966.1 hypothetical protein MCOR12_005556 [Pyricularia oryzae]